MGSIGKAVPAHSFGIIPTSERVSAIRHIVFTESYRIISANCILITYNANAFSAIGNYVICTTDEIVIGSEYRCC